MNARHGYHPLCLSLVVAVSILWACRTPDLPDNALPVRLIDLGASTELEETDFVDTEEAFVWPFDAHARASIWSYRQLESVGTMDGELAILASTDDPQLARDVHLAAADIDLIRVFLKPGGETTVSLYWAGAGEAFSEERSVHSRVHVGDPFVDFDVGSDKAWRGLIDRIRLDPSSTPGQRVELRRVVGLRKEPRTLASLPSEPRRIRLGSETRTGVLAPPDRPFVTEASISANATLHVGLGAVRATLPRAGPTTVHFQVSFVGQDGRTERLVDRTIILDRDSDPRWTDASADLSSLAGREGNLRFEASLDADSTILNGLPAYAHPEIVTDQPTGRAQPNVVLISVDTLRPDHMSLYGYTRETTPNVAQWAHEGAVFEQAIASAPWTLPSHASLLSGVDAVRHGANDVALPSNLPLLQEMLRGHGYTTAAVTGGAWVSTGSGFDRGFDMFYEWRGAISSDPSLEFDAGIRRARRWIANQADRPFFLFLHTYAVHAPWGPKEPFFREDAYPRPGWDLSLSPQPRDPARGFRSTNEMVWRRRGQSEPVDPGDLPTVRASYDSEIAYVDSKLPELWSELRTLGIEEDTMVILTSDHGEHFGEHGLFGHVSLYDENLLVPLIFVWPSVIDEAIRVGTQVRSTDVVPTVLELLQLPAPAPVDGISLAPMLTGSSDVMTAQSAISYAAKTNFGISVRTDDGFKYIFNDAPWAAPSQREELYELRTDPGEHENLMLASSLAPATVLEHLRRRAQSAASDVPGLRLLLTNRDERTLRIDIESPALRPFNVKLERPECDCAEWLEDGAIAIALPRRTSYLASIQITAGHSLEIRARHQSEPEKEGVLRFDPEPEAVWSLAYIEGEWTVGRGETRRPAVGVYAWWSGSSGALTDEMGKELSEQLRALGYVR